MKRALEALTKGEENRIVLRNGGLNTMIDAVVAHTFRKIPLLDQVKCSVVFNVGC